MLTHSEDALKMVDSGVIEHILQVLSSVKPPAVVEGFLDKVLTFDSLLILAASLCQVTVFLLLLFFLCHSSLASSFQKMDRFTVSL
jgi:hypothetical protein